jgi:hypothetical protein
MAHYNMAYRMVKTKGTNTALFINVGDPEALDTLRVGHGNRDIEISVPFYEAADPYSLRIYPLYFHITSSSLEQVRTSALEAVPYVGERFGIPDTVIDVLCTVGDIVPEDDNRLSYSGRHDSRGDTTPPEIVISVAPSVFDGRPTPRALALNCEFARQMREDGIEVDVDYYSQGQQFIPLPNAIRGTAGHHFIPVRASELLRLDTKAIFEMSKQPRPDDSYADTRRVPEAVEWFAETLGTAEKRQKQQLHLQQALLHRGWFVPPCIRRIEWAADTAREQALEACRITSTFYSFIGAGEDEVYEHVHRIDRRNGIGDYSRLKNIVAFSLENGAFSGCTNPFLQRFCPTGGCLMKELMNELKNPRLFA